MLKWHDLVGVYVPETKLCATTAETPSMTPLPSEASPKLPNLIPRRPSSVEIVRSDSLAVMPEELPFTVSAGACASFAFVTELSARNDCGVRTTPMCSRIDQYRSWVKVGIRPSSPTDRPVSLLTSGFRSELGFELQTEIATGTVPGLSKRVLTDHVVLSRPLAVRTDVRSCRNDLPVHEATIPVCMGKKQAASASNWTASIVPIVIPRRESRIVRFENFEQSVISASSKLPSVAR